MKKFIMFVATVFATLAMAFAEPRLFANGVGILDMGKLDNGYGYINIAPNLDSCVGANAYQVVSIICNNYEAAELFEKQIIKQLENTTKSVNPYVAYAQIMHIADRLNSNEFNLFYTLSHGNIKRENFKLRYTNMAKFNFPDGDTELKIYTFSFEH